jgi:UDPglucose 6-dehydrogenase
VKALIRTAHDYQSTLSVLEAVECANERQKIRLFDKVQQALGGSVKGAHVAIWGLAFKPNTDDMREAPSLTLIAALLERGATVTAHDPAAMYETRRRLGEAIVYAQSNYDALTGADALVVVTDWNEYRHPDFDRIKSALRRPIVVDGRNLYNVTKMRALGFTYESIGRAGQ